MKEALFEQTSVDIKGEVVSSQKSVVSNAVFRSTGQVVKFDGFIRAYTEGKDDESDEVEGQLPKLEKGMTLTMTSIDPLQHFTEPPPRYTDATLVKALEAEGIGRPSTYAPTLSTIQERDYVEKIEKRYHPTEVGTLVNDLLVANFPEIVDIKFTSHIEEELDDIAEGKIAWIEVCREFYKPFKKNLDEKEASVEKQIEISDTPCPHCGKPMLIKFGRMGKFLACPEGEKVTLPMPEEAAQIKLLEEKTKDEKVSHLRKTHEGAPRTVRFLPGMRGLSDMQRRRKDLGQDGIQMSELSRVGRNAQGKARRHRFEKITRTRKTLLRLHTLSRLHVCHEQKTGVGRGAPGRFQYWKENPPKPKEPRYKKFGAGFPPSATADNENTKLASKRTGRAKRTKDSEVAEA